MNKGYQNFKKRAGQLAIALTLAGTTAIGANAATVTGVTKANVNMRSGAGTKYKVVSVVKADKTVTILGQKGSWYKVKYNGKTGYISKSYVIKKNYTVKKYSGKYKTKVALTVRKGPGTNYVKAGTLKKGTVVTVKGKTSNGWLQISYKGATRYISGSSKYVAKYTAPVKNNAPVIDVEDTYTLTKGEDFEYAMLNATATDKEDGDLTDKIDFSGVVNTGKVGEYTVKLEVKDSKGATATKTVKVVVEDVKTNNKPSIAVDSTYEVKQNGSFNYADLKASAFDEEDGKLDIVYTGDVDTKTLGEYPVTLTATDKDGNKAVKVVTVKVVRNFKPIVKCEYDNKDKAYKVQLNKSFSLNDLKATANDEEDGNLTNKISYTIKDSTGKVVSSIDTTQEGSYTVTLTVVDSDGEKSAPVYVTVSVVKDGVPEIKFNYDTKALEGKDLILNGDEISIEQGDSLDLNTLKSIFNATAKDATDKDITSSIVVRDFDKVNTNIAKEYTVRFQVTDGGYGTYKEVTIKVVANKGPEIKVKPTIYNKSYNWDENSKEYTIPLNATFSVNQLNATAQDWNVIYSNPTEAQKTDCKVTFDGDVNTGKDGKYPIDIISKDAKGKESKERVYVVVTDYKDNQAPTISFDTTGVVGDNTIDVKGNTITIKHDNQIFKKEQTIKEQIDKLKDILNAKASDDRDKNLEVNYQLNHVIDVDAIGATYELTLTVTDNGDVNGENINTTTQTITINVVD